MSILPLVLTAMVYLHHAQQPEQGQQAVRVAQEPALDLLSITQQKLVEQQAKFFRVFSDGSLWTNKVEDDLTKLPPKAPVRAAYQHDDAPLWYCPATNECAPTEAAIFAALDAEDIEAQIKNGRYFTTAKALYITPQGILAKYGDQVLLVDPASKTEDVNPDDILKPFAAVQEETAFFRVPISDDPPPRPHNAPAGTPPELYRPPPSTPHREYASGSLVKVMKWKRVPVPPSRLEHKSKPVAAEELATAIRDGKHPGIVEWSARLEKATSDATGIWTWSSKTTKLTFKEKKPIAK